MEHPSKRFHTTKEAMVEDITSSLESMSESLASISATQSRLLRGNRAVVSYLRAVEALGKKVHVEESNESSTSSDE